MEFSSLGFLRETLHQCNINTDEENNYETDAKKIEYLFQEATKFINFSFDSEKIKKITNALEFAGQNYRGDPRYLNVFISTLQKANEKLDLVGKYLDLFVYLEPTVQIEPGDREEICRAAHRLIKEGMTQEKILSVFKSLAKVSQGEREEVSKLTDRYIKKSMDAWEIVGLLDAVVNVPEADRQEVCGAVQLYITKDINSWEIVSLLRAVQKVSKGEREQVCKLTREWITEEMSQEDIVLLLEAVANVSKEDREEVCGAVQLYIAKHTGVLEIKVLLDAVQNLVKGERQQICSLSRECIKGNIRVREIADLFDVMAQIPQEEREEVCKAAQPYIRESMNGDKIALILKTLRDVSKGEREQVSSLTHQYIKENMEAREIASLFEAIGKIPQEKREEVFTAADRYIKEHMNGEEIACLLKVLGDVSKEEREEVCRVADRYIKEDMNGIEIACLLKVLGDVSKEAREEVCKVAERYIKEGMNGEEIAYILKAIGEVPQGEREEVCRAADPYITNQMYIQEIIDVLNVVAKVSKGEREEVCRVAKPYITQYMHMLQIGELFNSIEKLPKGEREEVCVAAEPYIRYYMNVSEIADLFNALAEVSKEERKEVCKLTDQYNRIDVMGFTVSPILRAIAYIARADREEVCKLTHKYIRKNTSGSQIAAILKVIGEINKADREEVCSLVDQYIRKGIKLDVIDVLFAGIQTVPKEERSLESIDIILASHAYIEKRINTLIQDEKNVSEIKNLIDSILKNASILGILEESHLMQYLIRVMCIIDPVLENDPNNIYRIHERLLQRKQESVHLIARIEDKEYVLHLQELFKKVNEPITYGRLPKVDLQIFSHVFSSLEKRIEAATLEEKEKISEAIGLLGDYEQIKNTLISPLYRVQYWLTFNKAAKEQIAPKQMVEVYSLAEAIAKAPQTKEGDDVLTFQERFTLGMGASIQNCATGQDEGIHACYLLLGAKTEDSLKYASSAKEKILASLEPLIQQEINRIDRSFSDSQNPIIRELVSPSGIEQLVHQSLYLKNLLKDDLGLDHTLTLDTYGGCIDPSLRDKTRQEVLEVFLRHYNIDHLIDIIWGKLRVNLSEKTPEANNLYNAIIQFVGEKGISPYDILDLDEEDNPILKRSGVVILLESIGFLSPA